MCYSKDAKIANKVFREISQMFKLQTSSIDTSFTSIANASANFLTQVRIAIHMRKKVSDSSLHILNVGQALFVDEFFCRSPKEKIKRREVRGTRWPINTSTPAKPPSGKCLMEKVTYTLCKVGWCPILLEPNVIEVLSLLEYGKNISL